MKHDELDNVGICTCGKEFYPRGRGHVTCDRCVEAKTRESDPLWEMCRVLEFHGSKYTGNDVNAMAEDWDDHDFSAVDADEWCHVGVWDAGVAASFRLAGLTPEMVHEVSELISTDPTYDIPDPIEATCNGDVSDTVIISVAWNRKKKDLPSYIPEL